MKDDDNDCVMVQVDMNRGMHFVKHNGMGNYWHSKLIEAAKEDYFNRYELQCMSLKNDYFMFFDNFLDEYSIW